VPAPVPFPARRATSSGVSAALPGVSLLSLGDGSDAHHWARLPVTVSGPNVGDLELVLRAPAVFSGRIVYAPGTAPPANPRLVLDPRTGGGRSGWRWRVRSARRAAIHRRLAGRLSSWWTA
jgi:hypothetical protein